MLGDKSEHFEGKGTNLTELESHLVDYLQTDGFTVQTSPPSDQGTVIQATKGGFLRDVVAAERAFTITITGTSSDFTVRFGIGKWLKNLGVAAIETLLVSELFLVVDVADSLWSLEVEDKIIADLKKFVG
jgi:beta-lactamase superfamily II metal-dependent hydrolase